MTDDTEAPEEGDFDVFDDSEETEAGAEEAKVEETEEEKGEEQPQEDEEPESPSGENKMVSEAALLGERRRRQAAEEENQKLREQLQPEVDVNAPDPIEDPAGYEKYIEARVEKKALDRRITASRNDMLAAHPEDYETAENLFAVLATQDPSLVVQMNEHPRPAEFAYQYAKDYAANQVAALIPVEEEAQEAEETKADEAKAKIANTPDLTGAAAIGSNSEPLETMDDEDDLFEDSPYRTGVKGRF